MYPMQCMLAAKEEFVMGRSNFSIWKDVLNYYKYTENHKVVVIAREPRKSGHRVTQFVPDQRGALKGVETAGNCIPRLHGLTRVTVPASTTEVGRDAFRDCGVLTIYIPPNLTRNVTPRSRGYPSGLCKRKRRPWQVVAPP